jgi:signal transduction histidine kinase
LIINASAAADASSVSTTRATVESILDVLVRELRLDFACARLNASSAAAPADLVRLPGGRGADDARVRAAFSRCLDVDGHKWPFVIANPLGSGHVSIGVAPLDAAEKLGVMISGSSRAKFPTRSERQVLTAAAAEIAAHLAGMERPAESPELTESSLDEAAVPESTLADSEITSVESEPTEGAPDAESAAAQEPLSAIEPIASELHDQAMLATLEAPLASTAVEALDVYEANAALERLVRDTPDPTGVTARLQAFVNGAAEHRTVVPLGDAIAGALAFARPSADANAVSIRVETAAGVPPVLAQPIQLQQVIANLVVNAIEAMIEVNARRRVVTITARKHGTSAVLVRIRDAGKGIEPRERQRIFEPFYTTKAEGAGMGLTISRTIVEAHRGRLWASANDDFGETFQFTLPIGERDEAPFSFSGSTSP